MSTVDGEPTNGRYDLVLAWVGAIGMQQKTLVDGQKALVNCKCILDEVARESCD